MSTLYPVIGNPAFYPEVTGAIEKHGDQTGSIPIKTPFAETRFPITTYLWKNLRLGRGEHEDFLLLRSAEIFTFSGEEDRRGTVGFLLYIPGNEASDKTGEPSEEMIHNGIFLSAAYLAGGGNPIGNLELKDVKGKKTKELHFTELGKKKVFSPASQKQLFDDFHLFDALFSAQTFVFNTSGFIDILVAAKDIGIPAGEEMTKTQALFYDQFGPAFMNFKQRIQLVLSDPKRKARYEKRNPDFFPFARVLFTEADKVLALRKEDSDKLAELASQAETRMMEALEKFRWPREGWAEKPMTRADFYRTLGELEDPENRRDLTEKYSATVVAAHREAFFPMIENLNAMARKYGFKSYPDYYDRVHHGMTPKDFEAVVENFHTKYGPTIAAYMEELKIINGDEPVYEWDVDYLSQKLLKVKTDEGLPKLTFDEAMKIAKRWFVDIGWDLDLPPFKGNIFFDLKKRDNKYGNAFATAIGDGSRAWFNTNFDTREKISLEDLNTIIHELTHDVQSILGARRAGGSVAMGLGGSPGTWIEGSAMTMGDIVSNKNWIDRYLSHLPEFKDPEVRSVAADILGKQTLYNNMMVLGRALWENNLYEDKDENGNPISLDQRLKNWEALAKKYMHVETMDATRGGYIYATPHFAGSPGYYVSYGGGRGLGLLAMDLMFKGLAADNPATLKKGGEVFGAVLEEGARNINAAEVEQAIRRRLKNPGIIAEKLGEYKNGFQN